MRSLIGALAVWVLLLPTQVAAWDYPGHRIVGAIADLVIQEHYPKTARRVGELLERRDASGAVTEKRSLSQVAVFPDCAKPGNVPFCGRPPSEEEVQYAQRNPHHATFHYTDVPLQQPIYRAGTAGTDTTDIVQMIGYIVAQLSGTPPPAKPDVNLTDTEALWLLAHLVGDIHQPLHVGAKFFDATCETSVDPNVVGAGQPNFGIGATVAQTTGGNLILLAAPPPAVPPAKNLHFYWDGAAVVRAMQASGFASSEPLFARHLAAAPPFGWQTNGSPDTWALQWANEIMPLAVEAHDRLTIRKRPHPAPVSGLLNCTWDTTIDRNYEDWAAERAKVQITKAGFRLAALLKAIFKP